jgi:hypothetical protein
MDRVTASTFLRTWLWTLHNVINVGNGKAELPFADLATLYSDVNFQDMFWRLEPVMKLAIAKSGVGFISWSKWSATGRMLASLY